MKPKQPAGPPMTLGNMRALGVRGLDVPRLACRHQVDSMSMPWFEPRTA
jgi:hypothetical protein